MEIAICDDVKLNSQEIEAQINTLNVADNIYTFSDIGAFLSSINNGKRYDIVFMDIKWDSKKDEAQFCDSQQDANITEPQDAVGIDIAAKLYRLCPQTKVVYVTGYVELSQYILFNKSNLCGFLTKPVDIKLLQAVLQKAASELSHEAQHFLELKQKGSIVYIPTRKILFVESKGHTVNVHTTDESITSYMRLEGVMQQLPAEFFRCHKSFIVNMRWVRRFLTNEILLKNDSKVPVSRARLAATKEAYFMFMGQNF